MYKRQEASTQHINERVREHGCLCSTSGSLGPAANAAYKCGYSNNSYIMWDWERDYIKNMSRLHPSSQRSKTRTTARHFFWLRCKHCFLLLRSAIMCLSPWFKIILSPSTVVLILELLYSAGEQNLLKRQNFCQFIYMLPLLFPMLFKNTVCASL